MMIIKGIRISDKVNKAVCVKLQDILSEVHNGNLLYWSILDFYGMGDLGNGKSIPAFEKEVNYSEKGLLVKWSDLILLAASFWQLFDILIIGCANRQFIYRYDSDQNMYQNCDVVIELIDSNFWQVFSKNEDLITKLSKKFHDIEFLG